MSAPPLVAATGTAAYAIAIVMAVTALVTKQSGKAAYVDAAWGASFVAASWAAAATALHAGETLSWRVWVLLGLVTVWGMRLTWHLARRVQRTNHDDPRYEDFLGGPINSVPFVHVILKVFALQALLVLVVSVPLVLGVVHSTVSSWPVVVGIALWLLGAVFEAVSDAQLASYRADPHRPRILATGLWAWCRHPNYFGDFCVWWGFWLAGGVAGGWHDALTSVFAPLLMSWILIGVSGVRLAEKRMQGRPGWSAYAARTPIFLPWPPMRRNPIQ